jgi:hypothetical protein
MELLEIIKVDNREALQRAIESKPSVLEAVKLLRYDWNELFI